MNKKPINTIILLVILVAFVIAGIYIGMNKKSEPKLPDTNPGPDALLSKIEGNTEDLVSFSVLPETKITEPLVANGGLKNAWFFEANAVGRLLDANKNIIKSFPISATTDWMTIETVFFTVTIDPSGMPAGKGYIRIENDNPSGDPSKSKHIDVPVEF